MKFHISRYKTSLAAPAPRPRGRLPSILAALCRGGGWAGKWCLCPHCSCCWRCHRPQGWQKTHHSVLSGTRHGPASVRTPPSWARGAERPQFKETGAAFNGDVVYTFYTSYTPGSIFANIPRYVAKDASCKGCPNAGCCVAINGGTPQRGNISLHLATVAAAVRKALPPSFDGIAALDWEEWYPWYSTAGHADDPGHPDGRGVPPALSPRYIVESRDLARASQPPRGANSSVVEAEAQSSWNASSLSFLVETLRLCRQLRPHARWGFYNQASCWNNDRQQDPSSSGPGCTAGQEMRNDALAPLWAVGDVLLPSVYSGPLTSSPLANQTWHIRSQLAEAARIQRASSQALSLYAYTWYDARSGVLPTQWQPITSPAQLQLEFGEPKRAGGDGVIVWGTSTDAGVYLHPSNAAIARCRELASYFNNTLGPFLKTLAQS